MAGDSGCLTWEELPILSAPLWGQWVHSWALLQASQMPLPSQVSWVPWVSGVWLVCLVLRMSRASHVPQVSPVPRVLAVQRVQQVLGMWQVPRPGKMPPVEEVVPGSLKADVVGEGVAVCVIFELRVVSCI